MGLKVALEVAPPLPSPTRGWGDIASEGRTAHAIRFEAEDRSVSIASHCFRRWELKTGKTETLTILADNETVIVEGRHLSIIRDALDAGTLLIVRQAARRNGTGNETVVTGITFAGFPSGIAE